MYFLQNCAKSEMQPLKRKPYISWRTTMLRRSLTWCYCAIYRTFPRIIFSVTSRERTTEIFTVVIILVLFFVQKQLLIAVTILTLISKPKAFFCVTYHCGPCVPIVLSSSVPSVCPSPMYVDPKKEPQDTHCLQPKITNPRWRTFLKNTIKRPLSHPIDHKPQGKKLHTDAYSARTDNSSARYSRREAGSSTLIDKNREKWSSACVSADATMCESTQNHTSHVGLSAEHWIYNLNFGSWIFEVTLKGESKNKHYIWHIYLLLRPDSNHV